MRDQMLSYFKEIFGDSDGVRVYFAPGRVNLIGEHTDYNGGHVFPCALTIGTYAAVRKRSDRSLRFYSVNFRDKGIITSSLDELVYAEQDDWANYPKGVLWAFHNYGRLQSGIEKEIGRGLKEHQGGNDKESGKGLTEQLGSRGKESEVSSDKESGKGQTEQTDKVSSDSNLVVDVQINYGMDIVYYGNIPNGSGLSSSASIEVLTGFILKDLYGFEVDPVTIALLSQKAENRFIGVNCGIMDQFAIAMGKADSAIFLNTGNLQYEYAPIELGDAKLVIANTYKKRGLGDSKYNERRSQCEEALARLKTVTDLNSLGELREEEFEKYKEAIKDEILIKRAKHAVYENQRTIRAVEALMNKDIVTFGLLMNASHVSLRDDYEVTGIELDTLVEAAWEQEGVIGARMTGAGFGGCTVNILKSDYIDQFIERVGKSYVEKIGYKADFYVVEIGDGPREI